VSITASVYAKARSEILALFGWNGDSLTPEQTLRLDCAVALRLALDDLQGRICRGELIDVTRMLTASEALARLLPATVLATPPAESRADPRLEMWQIYKTMRERGEIDLKPDAGLLQAKINEQAAEIERLKAGSAPALLGHDLEEATPALPDVPMVVERVAIDPAIADITPPSELGECYVGTKPGPDDPKPRRPGPVIEGTAVRKPPSAPAAVAPAPRPAAPAYDYNVERGWRDRVLPDGTITPTPMSRGRWWGPV
jgi:hypothetical protein